MKTPKMTPAALHVIDDNLFDSALALMQKDGEESYLKQYCTQLGEENIHDAQQLEVEDVNDDLYPLLDQHIPNGLKSVYKPNNIAPIARRENADVQSVFTQINMPTYWLNSPYAAGQRLAAELYRAVTATGSTLAAHGLHITLANTTEETAALAQLMLGLDDAYAALGVTRKPCSLNMLFDKGCFNVTHFGVGQVPDGAKLLSPYFRAEDQHIYVLGREHGHLGLSAYLNDAHDSQEGDIPALHFDRELLLAQFITDMHKADYITSCQSVSIGGIGLALAKMALGSNIGCSVGGIGNASFWYGEDQGRYIVTIKTVEMAKFEVAAQDLGISLLEIGNSEEDRLSFNNQEIKISTLT
jgi:phosphoribosylformylglycinamidine synthase